MGISAGAIYKYVEWWMVAFRRMASIPTQRNAAIKAHGRIVFELEDPDNFIEQYSEKHGAGNKLKILEKSPDNFN